MFKKILTAILCVSVALIGSVSVSAANTTESVGKSFKHIQKYSQSADSLVIYTYGISSSSTAAFRLDNVTKKTSSTYYFKDYYYHPGTIPVNASDTYMPMSGVMGGYSGGTTFKYNNIAGKYEMVKIKLSDFSAYFNSDGSHTQSNAFGVYTNKKFYFVDEPKQANGDRYASSLVIESDGAVNCVAPDKNGEVQIVVSKRIGADTYFSTDYAYSIVSNGYSKGSGGGVNHSYLQGLTIGDTDLNGNVDVTDATYIQRKIANMQSFDTLQTRNGDLNADGKIDVTDATYVQMYIAKML